VVLLPGGNFGGGENASFECSVSNSSICDNDEVCSHAGGAILARFCFLSSSASQRGMLARCGGCNTGVVPYNSLVSPFITTEEVVLMTDERKRTYYMLQL
jgi:hypothetical protein